VVVVVTILVYSACCHGRAFRSAISHTLSSLHSLVSPVTHFCEGRALLLRKIQCLKRTLSLHSSERDTYYTP